VSRKWTANERRAEIMRILESSRQETKRNLASYFGVSYRTIGYDIQILTASYPLEPLGGAYGGIKVPDDFAMYRSFFSDAQQETLIEIFPTLNKAQANAIFALLQTSGSKRYKERIEGLI